MFVFGAQRPDCRHEFSGIGVCLVRFLCLVAITPVGFKFCDCDFLSVVLLEFLP